MRVKIGDRWFDSDDQPLCVQLSELEQQQISELNRDVYTEGKFAVFPTITKRSEALVWMRDE